MEEITITLETLYDILRNEKKREDLQKLNESFFLDVVGYLREKQSFLENQKDVDNPFASGEKEKLEYELRSIKRILKEIYEKREKKIIDIALNRSRTGSDIIDTSSMLREEKDFYQRILNILDGFRRGVLLNLFHNQLPDLSNFDPNKINLSLRKFPEINSHQLEEKLLLNDEESSTIENKSNESNLKKENIPKIKIKFINPVPSFVWKDMKVYGPFDTGEETEIFPEVAELMVRKGRAIKI